MITHMTHRNVLRAAVVAALITALAGCRSKPLAWVDVAPAGAGFKVQMPGEPHMTTQAQPTAVGNVNVQMWQFKQPQTMYAIAVAQAPEIRAIGPPDDVLLDGSVAGMIQNSGAKLESQTPITLQGYKGREVHAKGPDGSTMVNRIYIVGSTQYQVMVANAPGSSDAADMQKFQNSFQIVK